MNKDVKKALAVVEEKETKNRESISRCGAELEANRNKLVELKAQLKGADNADQYKGLLREIRDTEAVIEFLEARLKEYSAGLTPDERNKLVTEIKKAFAGARAEYFKTIAPEIDKLVKLMNDYDQEVAELNAILNSKVNPYNGMPVLLNAREICAGAPDPFDPHKVMFEAFFRMKGNLAMTHRV